MSDESSDIDRLTLRLHGVSARDGKLVAGFVADWLAEEPSWRHTSDLKVHVTAQGAPEEIARSVLVELWRQLGVDR
jgi:hypothetical protein